MALTTAGVAAMVPASPMPLTPSGLTGDGVQVKCDSNDGSSAAVGTAYSISEALTGWPFSS